MKVTVGEKTMFVETEHRKGGESMSTEFEEKQIEGVMLEGEDIATIEGKLDRR